MQGIDCAKLVGSPTCANALYLTLIGGRIFSSETISDVLSARHHAGLSLEIDHVAISHLLHDGFVPQPRTVYRDVFSISVGFTAIVKNGALEFQSEFPFDLARSRCDQEPSTRRLLDRLIHATEAACKGGSGTILLLSGGLDSTSIALAAKELGRKDISCVTYGESGPHSEIELAQDFCRRIGLHHESYVLDTACPTICRDLVAYAGAVPEPCADPALTACVSPIFRYGGANTVVLDGSGSDFYFWAPPRPLDLLKMRFGLSRLPAIGYMRQLLPVYLPYERLLSTPLEPFLLHGSWLRHCDTREFYEESANTHAFWLKEFQDQASAPREEARYRNRAVYVGPGAHMKKTRNAALAVGAHAKFPWADGAVADYCFNLPEQSRFDRKTRKSKQLVREMLREFSGYNDKLIGKRPFLFGKRRFLENHLGFCRDEILSCTLWTRDIERAFAHLSKMFKQGHATENALFALMMVSLWHNHWINKNLQNVLLQEVPLRRAV